MNGRSRQFLCKDSKIPGIKEHLGCFFYTGELDQSWGRARKPFLTLLYFDGICSYLQDKYLSALDRKLDGRAIGLELLQQHSLEVV